MPYIRIISARPWNKIISELRSEEHGDFVALYDRAPRYTTYFSDDKFHDEYKLKL